MTFLPAYVKDILNGGSELLGILLSCIGIGSFSAAIYLAARKSVSGLSKVIMSAALILGISLLLLLYQHPVMAAVVCIPAGYSLIITVASINTLLQTFSDEDKRGRVMGYLAMTFTGIAPIGSMILGVIEKYTGLPLIILISGIACIFAGGIFEYNRPRIIRHAHPSASE